MGEQGHGAELALVERIEERLPILGVGDLAPPTGWIKGVGVLSPNVKVPAEWYAGNYKLKVANDIASGATAIGFDASDLMPPAVGQGSRQLTAALTALGEAQRRGQS